MLLLAVDIGNSNVTLGLFEAERLAATWRLPARTDATHDELAMAVEGLVSIDGRRAVEAEGVAIASVVPALTPLYQRMARERLATAPLLVDAEALAGLLPIAVDRPQDVGVDRLLNALAVATERGGPAIVVDLGTATTFDVVAADGSFLGGAIAPGIDSAQEGLLRAAPRLPRVELRRPARAIGTDTISALQSGAVNGAMGLITGLLGAIRRELEDRSPAGSKVSVIATGGHSLHPWIREVPGIDEVDPELTLRGLRIAYRRLREEPAEASAEPGAAARPSTTAERRR